VGVFFYDDLSSDHNATVPRLLRFLGLPYHPAEGKNVPRANVSGVPRSSLPQRAIVTAACDEVVHRTVKNSRSLRFCGRIPHSSLQRSAVLPAVEVALRSAYDEHLAELTAFVSSDVPPWLSEARLSEAPR
jgi:hypothetical protein